MFNTNDMHIVRNCQMYFNFDMPSTLWAKRVRTFNVKFSASNNVLQLLQSTLKLKALHEKIPGVRNPCSFRTAYRDAGGSLLK